MFNVFMAILDSLIQATDLGSKFKNFCQNENAEQTGDPLAYGPELPKLRDAYCRKSATTVAVSRWK